MLTEARILATADVLTGRPVAQITGPLHESPGLVWIPLDALAISV